MTNQRNPDGDDRYALALGRAVIHLWAALPRDVQEKLFEHAVIAGHLGERDESLREQLAKHLHDHHARTQVSVDQHRAGAS
ncbi:MAG: hypothetical protein JO000_28315 [Alphaproteobacteria bacterium]|nr:hypothetical protein [Alphaproteobacteria bacterium]